MYTSKSIFKILAMVFPLFLTACQADPTINQDSVSLSVSFVQSSVSEVESRATFNKNSEIGLFLMGGDGEFYGATGYANAKATKINETNWSITPSLFLTEESGTLYSYYPYSSSVTDYMAVPVTAGTKDYMFGTAVGDINMGNNQLTVTMNHALAKIAINLLFEKSQNNGFPHITFSSQSLYGTGTMDLSTGAIIPQGNAGVNVNPGYYTWSGTKINKSCLYVIPGTETDGAELVIRYAGETHTIDLPAITYLAGNAYNYNIKYNDGRFILQSTTVSVYLDGTDTTYNSVVDDGCTVTLEFDTTSSNEKKYFCNSSAVEKISYMEIDGTEVTPVYYYTFSTTGQHTVKIKFTDAYTIPASAFSGYSINKVTISGKVLEIGNKAFYNCKAKITSMDFLQYCAVINDYAFYSNYFSGAIEIPRCTTYIGIASLPNGDSSITYSSDYTGEKRYSAISALSVNPENPVYDSRNNCNAVMNSSTGTLVIGSNNTVIPDDCTAIADYAFFGCRGLTGTIIIPEDCKSIGQKSFYYCRGITGLQLGSSFTAIGEKAFYECRNMGGTLTIPETCTYIGTDAFSYCQSLTGHLTIPGSITEIHDGTFAFCSSLTGLTLSEGLKEIGINAFEYCGGLTGSLVIPETCTSIMSAAFEYCENLKSVIIGDGVNTIKDKAFYYCEAIESVFIGKNVNSLHWEAFNYCRNLSSIIVDSNNPVYDSRENCNAVMLTATNELIIGCMGTVIPDNCTHISGFSFLGAGQIGNLTIPDSVLNIGDSAFARAGITSINFGSGLRTIGGTAFYDCVSLTGTLFIPSNVKFIESSAFEGCVGITGLILSEGLITIGSHAFEDCNGLVGKTVTVPSTVTSTGTHAFSFGGCGCWEII